ncbi:MAG: HU family DNA-binding protein [Deltaproteobacteria bacterium]|nr:HU family DNA-binding protein [Deltaproteobacteria bacterium]
MSKRELVDHLYQQQAKRNLTHRNIEDVVDTFFLHLSTFILRRKEYTCAKFGRFEVRKKNKRRIKHPQTGQWLEVPSKKTIHFQPSPVLKKKVNS